MSRQARVTAPYATVRVPDAAGKPTVVGFYAGMFLPEGADPADVERLVRREYAEWVEAPAPEPEPKPEPVKASKAVKAAE